MSESEADRRWNNNNQRWSSITISNKSFQRQAMCQINLFPSGGPPHGAPVSFLFYILFFSSLQTSEHCIGNSLKCKFSFTFEIRWNGWPALESGGNCLSLGLGLNEVSMNVDGALEWTNVILGTMVKLKRSIDGKNNITAEPELISVEAEKVLEHTFKLDVSEAMERRQRRNMKHIVY